VSTRTVRIDRRYGYRTCDVFTERRYGGNPLAVGPDARGLAREGGEHA